MLRTIAHRLALGLNTRGRMRDWWSAALLLVTFGLVAVPFGLASPTPALAESIAPRDGIELIQHLLLLAR